MPDTNYTSITHLNIIVIKITYADAAPWTPDTVSFPTLVGTLPESQFFGTGFRPSSKDREWTCRVCNLDSMMEWLSSEKQLWRIHSQACTLIKLWQNQIQPKVSDPCLKDPGGTFLLRLGTVWFLALGIQPRVSDTKGKHSSREAYPQFCFIFYLWTCSH